MELFNQGLKAVVIHCWLQAREISDYCTRSYYQARENTSAELELSSKRGKTWGSSSAKIDGVAAKSGKDLTS